ncbi:hypothetical protein B6K86_09050 [Lachnospiraceae bacterium]|nr:hypothetical protein B6K86_09050 [Lachnospiraceae bacterium]
MNSIFKERRRKVGEPRLLPVSTFRLADIVVQSYMPNEIKSNGACLAMGVMFAAYGNNLYKFDFLLLRRPGEKIFSEPLVYKDLGKLLLKEVCQDIQMYMGGQLGSVYVQMIDPQTNGKIGASFWNFDRDSRSFSVAYYATEGFNVEKLSDLVNQVYLTFIVNHETIMTKMEL